MTHIAKDSNEARELGHRRPGRRRTRWAAIVGGAAGLALALVVLAVVHAPIEGDGTIVLLLAPIAGIVVGVALGVGIEALRASNHPPAQGGGESDTIKR